MDSDVIIGGGGFVGMALGLALARGGLSVTVIDPVTADAALQENFDGRVSALSYASLRLFRALGAEAELAPYAQPIEQILVTDAPLDKPASPFSLYFDGQEIGEPLGAIAENRAIRRALFSAVADEPQIKVVAPASVTGIIPGEGSIGVRLSTGETLFAKLAVAADGRDSKARDEMGIGVVRWDYPQSGIVATVHHERPHNGTAYEHFLPSGPFAILPLTGNRASLVWTEKRDIAQAMMALPQAEFEAEIARRFGKHLGAIHQEGPRWSYPLRFHLARGFVKSRFALAGDAAHGIHPIAGQGLNLGLRDAAALADVLLDAAALGQDIGALDVLKRYEQWRRFDSVTQALTMDALNRLFSNDIAPLRLARDLGMGIVDKIGPLRRYFMREAGGDVGKLPSLMRA
ncbi:2-octaprenyl-6-methoxyphenol hydroxylase [Rhizomicrobium palustre]|uniref:2-octaprenyl-6-methoxyphenol hydroxylase n=1 Tax=Rhizomicrobium palustre TaxID=189966 RepID=A0A846MWH7_9PROT|nr:FAD-dependent monooxygenase [Rhizomicrobium palustre]NIK87908.1 2-octaprenyl-6-methoxyphenol hydroxylase [Rhizomicrobium palustre]